MRNNLDLLRRTASLPAGMIGLIILVLMAGMALSAPYVYPEGPWTLVGRPYLWPFQNGAYPLGTDAIGRDILACIFYGARVSMAVGIVAATCSLMIGVFVGSVAGFYGRMVDAVLMRMTEAFQTIPSFLFAVVLVAIMAPSVTTIITAIALVTWPSIARLTRAEVLRVREMEYVQSCRTIGMWSARIIFTQVLPNSISPVIVASSVLVSSAIMTEAGLSFLGLGDPNVMSWGTIINVGRPSIRTSWFICIIPSLFVLGTVLSLNLLGDALNDALNPHMRKR